MLGHLVVICQMRLAMQLAAENVGCLKRAMRNSLTCCSDGMIEAVEPVRPKPSTSPVRNPARP